MLDILSYVPGRRKNTARGWASFNAVCCHHRGHKPDRRMRGGIKTEGREQIYHCFNCGFSCKMVIGETLHGNTKKFLRWCGVDEEQITKISFESLKHRDLIDYIVPNKKHNNIEYKEVELPEGELLDEANPNHKEYIEYLNSRKIKHDEYPFMITPNDVGRKAKRIVIPFTLNNKVIGFTSRFLDTLKPKYLNEHPPGYLFGYDLQKPEWTVCLVTEGIFDAISINGCALGTSTINQEQKQLLANLNRTIIVVPDQDKTGLELCEQAYELGYKVSLPEWGFNQENKPIKDTNEATVKFGKLPTLLSILQSATRSKVKIELMRRKIERRIQS